MTTPATNWDPTLCNDQHAYVHQYGQALIDLLKPIQPERILDLGCGTGELTAQIAETARSVVGIDSAESMIDAARANFNKPEFQVMDAADFHFDEPFDAIFSNAALHWVTDYQGAIRCMHRNLNPRGRLVLEFGGNGNVQTIVKQLRATLAGYGYSEQSKRQPWYFPSIGAYAGALEAAGFSVVMAHHYDRPTELADREAGIVNWLTMFGEHFLSGISQQDAELIKKEVQDRLRSTCLINNKWYADYKRIRILAVKEV